MSEAPAETLQGLVIRWAGRRLGFDARALRMERMLEAAQTEVSRLGSAAALEAALDSGDPEADMALVAAATVGETYFFRQREHFDLITELPRPLDGPLLTWSAGCATGEEAYSLAAALRNAFALDASRLAVWGTDINARSLELARKAEYGRWSWRQGGGRSMEQLAPWALDAGTRACVRFARHNLLDEAVFDGGAGERFDLVFCRNVLVYFAPEAAVRAVARIRQAMKPGAWLILGNMDLGGSPEGMRRVGPQSLCVYAKSSPPAPRAAAAPAAEQEAPRAPKAPTVPPPLEALDPVEWHNAVLAELEAGDEDIARQELEQMVDVFPDYLPGLFEHALVLRRDGRLPAAAAILRELLRRAEGHDPAEMFQGPEPISLEFYVTSARSFLESAGGRP